MIDQGAADAVAATTFDCRSRGLDRQGSRTCRDQAGRSVGPAVPRAN